MYVNLANIIHYFGIFVSIIFFFLYLLLSARFAAEKCLFDTLRLVTISFANNLCFLCSVRADEFI